MLLVLPKKENIANVTDDNSVSFFFKLKLLITITNNKFNLELQYYLHVVN